MIFSTSTFVRVERGRKNWFFSRKLFCKNDKYILIYNIMLSTKATRNPPKILINTSSDKIICKIANVLTFDADVWTKT